MPFKNHLNFQSGLTFVGVGPGDPSLMTIAAVEAINNASLVAYPVTKIGEKSIAGEIASELIKEKKCLPIVFPMVQEDELLQSAWEEASFKLAEEVRNGEQVALLCQGDPSLYATSAYVLNLVKLKYPFCSVKVIPGVSSFNAAAAIAKVPLSLQKEQLLVCPAPDIVIDLEMLLDDVINSKKVLVLIKLGKRWLWVRKVLQEKGLLSNSVFAQRVGFSDQVILNAQEISIEDANYFSLLIVRKGCAF
ncbi:MULTISPECIES: precorrin-2 C(20)-methyltransferase [unclassified Prochlorococcus]|uniref:precorrin-2 C(20)-methyltransferase n=1 Tax=unclassified Prochlorococcus TaxID=2627481 RepID=UPI0005339E58|nr:MULTISPECIES: precorrin-2 C(20)-methyltransferase [unclassified Prochlorococcus]KGG16574.1 Cobalt-precorrin-2 C20-methyltransferase [Prochlorococcus sp. MIT 0602]KGG16951.1 Cobalt-precorrin-2 C20-methyltransferase [Prochlorococcus sp. MIT 0603]